MHRSLASFVTSLRDLIYRASIWWCYETHVDRKSLIQPTTTGYQPPATRFELSPLSFQLFYPTKLLVQTLLFTIHNSQFTILTLITRFRIFCRQFSIILKYGGIMLNTKSITSKIIARRENLFQQQPSERGFGCPWNSWRKTGCVLYFWSKWVPN